MNLTKSPENINKYLYPNDSIKFIDSNKFNHINIQENLDDNLSIDNY